MSDPSLPPSARRWPWLKIVLAISLVLNMALLGVLGGVFSRLGTQGSTLRAAVGALPVDERRALRDAARDHWRGVSDNLVRSRIRDDLQEILRAEEFDAAAFEQTLRASQERLVMIGTQMRADLVASIAAMSPQERRDYADKLARRGTWRNRGVPERSRD